MGVLARPQSVQGRLREPDRTAHLRRRRDVDTGHAQGGDRAVPRPPETTRGHRPCEAPVMTNIDICRQVFANWSSRPADNEPLFHADAVLVDIVAGTHEGWPAMEAFFAKGLGYWQDMRFELHEFWE